MVTLYTDGGYSIAKEIGGWAMVVVDEDLPMEEQVIYTENGTVEESTSNRMEMTAFITALDYAERNKLKEVEILTDSNYVVQGYKSWSLSWKKKGWIKSDGKPIKNKDLWITVDSKRREGITVTWVKGHSGNKYNELVDSLTRDYQ